MFPKKGKTLHRGPADSDRKTEFRQEVAVALKSELGSSPQVVKTVRGVGAEEAPWLWVCRGHPT